MIAPDANLLIYAYDQTSPHHAAARSWWQDCLNGTEPVLLCQPVIFAFIRIITSTRLMHQPLSVAHAVAAVESWLGQPVVRVATQDEHFPARVFLLLANGMTGNLTTDAMIAASALEVGANVHTNDADFRTFPGLSWFNPLTGIRTENP